MINFYNEADNALYKQPNSQFITQERFRGDVAPNPQEIEEEKITETFGIPATTVFQNSGGGGGAGPTFDLIGNFNQDTTAYNERVKEGNRPMRPERRTANYNQPGQGVFTPEEQPTFKRKVSDFMYDNIPYINRPQSYEDIMTKGYQEPEGPGMPSLIGFLNKMGIQNFAGLPQADQAFIKSQSGYRGPTVFGENTAGGNVDPFKMNVESLFGNYAEAVKKDHTKLSDLFSATDKGSLQAKYGVTWDEDEGIFKGANAQKAMDMTKALRTRWRFRKNQVNKQGDIKKELTQIDKNNALAGKSSPGDKSRTGSLGRRPGSGGNVDRVTKGPGQNVSNVDNQAYDDGGREGYGYGLKKGGRVGYFFGGLAARGMTTGQHAAFRMANGGRINFKNGGLASILYG